MRFRLVIALAATAIVVAGCGAVPNTASLEKLPVAPSLSGAPAGGVPAVSVAVAGGAGGVLPEPFADVEYRLGATLPPLPATAPAYVVVAAPASGNRHRIAAALGLADSDRHLFVGSDTGSWSFDLNCAAPPDVNASDNALSGPEVGFACASEATSAPSAGIACAIDAASVCTPPTLPQPVRPADLPSKQAAIDQTRSLFHALGVDISVDKLQVTDGITQWIVTADPVVGGLPTTGRSISATIGPKGSVLAARGLLGTANKLGDYPLVDAATVGFKRLVDQEAHRPRPMIVIPAPCQADVPNCSPRNTPQVVTITGVHLALQQLGSNLVPVFIYEIGPNQTTTPVAAVTDDLLNKTNPTPPTIPQPQPDRPAPPTNVAPGGTPTRP